MTCDAAREEPAIFINKDRARGEGRSLVRMGHYSRFEVVAAETICKTARGWLVILFDYRGHYLGPMLEA